MRFEAPPSLHFVLLLVDDTHVVDAVSTAVLLLESELLVLHVDVTVNVECTVSILTRGLDEPLLNSELSEDHLVVLAVLVVRTAPLRVPKDNVDLLLAAVLPAALVLVLTIS